jgi:hypothetical protein
MRQGLAKFGEMGGGRRRRNAGDDDRGTGVASKQSGIIPGILDRVAAVTAA